MEQGIRFQKWMAWAAVGLAILLCIIWSAIFMISRPVPTNKNGEISPITVIPAPTQTLTPTITPTVDPASLIDTKGLSIGGAAQISGTGGAGLRLRENAGTEARVKFIAMDSEVFEITQGPVEKDGYVWWYIVSPYDESRSGWAASDFLSVLVPQSQE
jgi:hypothetical protein